MQIHDQNQHNMRRYQDSIQKAGVELDEETNIKVSNLSNLDIIRSL